ncbi:unnamed protein product [Durusdinium trenchii]|uniref:Uncharacterized protein n=1 Tax=Durusdinium trenchii TaxID=1381693 RepID=A0ABP0NNH3_9DINO
MLGGSSRDPSIKSMHLWSSILTMDDAKQNIFIQRVLMLHEIALKQGGRASIPRLALSDWNTLADQFCFLGHCLKHMWEKTDSSGNRMFNDALITSICKRCVEGDYMSDAETALEVLDPQFNPEETTMFKEHKPEEVDAVKEQVAQCDAQVSVLNQDARKAQFEADCLALARDLAQVASLYKVIEKGERGRRSDKDREQNTFNGCQIMLDRSLSEVQEAAQLLSGEQLPRILLNSVLMKSGVSSGGTVGIMNLTPYDAWLERTCHKGFDGMTFRTVSTTKNLQISQYVEKVLALDLMEDWPYEKDPPPPPPGQGEVDPSAYPLKVVKYGRKNAAEIQALVVAAQEEQKAPPVKIVPWEEPVALEQVMDQYVVETKFSGRMAGTSLLLVRARRRDGSLSQVVDDQEFKLFIVVWRHFMGRMTDQR